MRASHLFAILTICLSMLISFSDGLGNCTSAGVSPLRRQNTYYEIRGLFVRVLPARNFEPIYNVGEVSWEPFLVVERNKTLKTVGGLPFQPGLAVCQIPGGIDFFSPSYNPAYETLPGELCPGSFNAECGALLQSWRPEDFDCYAESYIHTIQGVQVETVAVHSWLAGHPGSFAFTSYYQLAERDFQYTVPRDVYQDSTVSFTKDVMKMSYTLSNVPWLYDNSPLGLQLDPNIRDNASFLSLFYRSKVNSSLPGKMIFESTGNSSTTAFHSDDGTFKIFLGLDLQTVLDNITSTSPGPPLPPIGVPLQPGVGFSGFAAVIFCPLNQGHWNLMEYDPSISALFSGPIHDSDPPGGLSKEAIAGITVGAIFGVVVLIVVIVILSKRSEAFKRFIRPFTARRHAANGISPKDNPHQPLQTGNVPTESKWASASKPPPL